MHPEEKAAVEQLLVYAEETAGRIMTPDVFSVRVDTDQEREGLDLALHGESLHQ